MGHIADSLGNGPIKGGFNLKGWLYKPDNTVVCRPLEAKKIRLDNPCLPSGENPLTLVRRNAGCLLVRTWRSMRLGFMKLQGGSLASRSLASGKVHFLEAPSRF